MTDIVSAIPTAILSGLQHRLGLALRDRVAGSDAHVRASRIWGAPGPRWFSPGDPIWRVHGDAAMFPGGIAALLLQSLHPLAMAGVAGHSGYKGDPWGRLQRTSHYLATTTYGTIEDAEAAIAHVRGIHQRVRGKDDRGVPYSASDPELLRWVHVAEAYSFLTSHQMYAAVGLTSAEADTYVAQGSVAATRLGATRLPATVVELEAQLEAFRPQLAATAAAREAARFLLLNPPLPRLMRPGYAALAAGGVTVLPSWARSALRLPLVGPLSIGARGLGALGTRAVRWGMAAVQSDPKAAASNVEG